MLAFDFLTRDIGIGIAAAIGAVHSFTSEKMTLVIDR